VAWQGRLRAEQDQANKSPRRADQEALRKPSGTAENQAETGVLAESSSWLGGGSLQLPSEQANSFKPQEAADCHRR
jgi:hypothetical protein